MLSAADETPDRAQGQTISSAFFRCPHKIKHLHDVGHGPATESLNPLFDSLIWIENVTTSLQWSVSGMSSHWRHANGEGNIPRRSTFFQRFAVYITIYLDHSQVKLRTSIADLRGHQCDMSCSPHVLFFMMTVYTLLLDPFGSVFRPRGNAFLRTYYNLANTDNSFSAPCL